MCIANKTHEHYDERMEVLTMIPFAPRSYWAAAYFEEIAKELCIKPSKVHAAMTNLRGLGIGFTFYGERGRVSISPETKARALELATGYCDLVYP